MDRRDWTLRAWALGMALTIGMALVVDRPADAQRAGPELRVGPVDTSAYPAVKATLTLVGAPGPAGLSVVEDGVSRPATVAFLGGDELDVMLVLDTSGSMAGAPLAAAKGAASTFLARLPAQARVGLIGFGSAPVLAIPFTADRAVVMAAVGALTAGGETSLYDALAQAADQFSGPARRSIVVLSDGGDTVSSTDLAGAVAKVRAAGAGVNAVELVTRESNPAALGQIAAAGGGRVAPATDTSALTGILGSIADDLGGQYLVTYTSGGHGPVTVTFQAQVPGATVSALARLELPALPGDLPGAAAPGGAGGGAGAPAPQPTPSGPAPSWASGRLLAYGAGAVFLALALAGLVAFSPRPRRAFLGTPATASPVAGVPGEQVRTGLSGLARRATKVAEGALDREGRHGRLNRALERAGIALRPSEFAVLVASLAAAAALLGLLFGLLAALLAPALVVLATRTGLRFMTARRQARFASQLGDVLQLLAGSLRSGYGLFQAIDAVAKEAEVPACDEFRRLVVETRLGRDQNDCLAAMAERMASVDFGWVVSAIEIHREVGGDLAEVLDNVAATIRERDQIRRQVKALSVEGRISAYILLALPVVIVLILNVLNPGYISELGRGFGLVLSAMALMLMGLGTLWMKKICRLVF